MAKAQKRNKYDFSSDFTVMSFFGMWTLLASRHEAISCASKSSKWEYSTALNTRIRFNSTAENVISLLNAFQNRILTFIIVHLAKIKWSNLLSHLNLSPFIISSTNFKLPPDILAIHKMNSERVAVKMRCVSLCICTSSLTMHDTFPPFFVCVLPRAQGSKTKSWTTNI